MPSPGERLAGRYELIEPIGSGGMAVVWRARDLRLGRPVAVKLLRAELAEDEDVARRFESEARRAASLSHPNVAGVYDTDIDDGRQFIVMELVDGPSVAELLAERGRLEPEEAVDIAAAAARALAAAHRRGLIHRDVKPANLLVGRDGRTRLADFGIARALTANRMTLPGTVLGSIPYLSPEQARGDDASAHGDVFSLGVVLFEMLTGRLPWEAETPAALATVRLHAPAPAPSTVVTGLPEGLDTIVARALAPDPGERYPSARVFADALEAWNRGRRRVARAAARGSSRGRAASARPQLATAGAAAAAAAGAGGTGRRAQPRKTKSKEAVAASSAAAAAIVGTANPNPAARKAGSRRATRRAAPAVQPLGPAGAAVPAAAAVPARAAHGPAPSTSATLVPEEGESAQRRRGDYVLAALALLLLGAVAVGMLFGGDRGGLGSIAVATPSPAPTLAVLGPAVEPTMAATPSAAPTATSSITEPPPTLRPQPTQPPTPGGPGPARTVASFYDAVVRHDWDRAIDLWSPSMQQRYPPDEWLIDRFRPTTRIDITLLVTDSVNREAGTARVSVSLVEYRRTGPSPRTFVGSWDLVRIDGEWKLDRPHF
jgi:hypothetical protein